jgi:hypothetical protein
MQSLAVTGDTILNDKTSSTDIWFLEMIFSNVFQLATGAMEEAGDI